MFKENDIIRLKNYCNKYTFYKIKEVDETLMEAINLTNDRHRIFTTDEMVKVTFYELLDFIRENKMKLSITVSEDKRTIIENLWGIYGQNQITEDDKLILVTDYTLYDFIYDLTDINYMDKLFIDYDDIDFETDYTKYCAKQKLKDISNIADNEILDAFKKYIIYGEESTFEDVLNNCFKKYKDYILQEEDPLDNLEIGDVFEYKNNLYYLLTKSPILSAFEFVDGKRGNHIISIDKDDYRNDYFKNHYTKYDMKDIIEEGWNIDMKKGKLKNLLENDDKGLEPEPVGDEIYVNNKKKTVVIKWADDRMTKATCDKEDKYDLEKGVLYAMLKRFYAVEYINSMLDKAKKSQELDMQRWKAKENKKEKIKVSIDEKEAKKVIDKLEKVKNKK